MADRSGDAHAPRAALVTGGAGFIGANLVRHLLESDPALSIVTLDALTYAGSEPALEEVARAHGARHHLRRGDVRDAALVSRILEDFRIDTIVHLAAETHVDRSIDDPSVFVATNVEGTFVLLDAARRAWAGRCGVRFHHVSTDEVYGSLSPGALASEGSPCAPSSPYSATKAASDHLVMAWARTYGLPVTLTRSANNYGPWQYPEKLIPLSIARAIAGDPILVYGDGGHERDWLHVSDHCRAIDLVVRRGEDGRAYNVGAGSEHRNLDVVGRVCDLLDEMRPRSGGGSYRALISRCEDRPGHDQRYALDCARIRRELGWAPAERFEDGLRRTAAWYLDHEAWWRAVLRGRRGGERLGLGLAR